MIEQLTLEGIERLEFTAIDNLGLTHRSHQPLGEEYHQYLSEPASTTQASTDIPQVSIYTLGRFSLLLNGKPAEFGRKAPRRPLELLKAIIALGGREISTASLISVLWPDVDGDTAQRSFDTTLHRLRKILGDRRVLKLKEGKFSLEGRNCWVDAWSFERLLG